MKSIILFFVFTVASCSIIKNKESEKNATHENKDLSIWTEAAYRWVMRLNCTDVGVLCGQNCRMAKQMRQRDFRIYAVKPVKEQKFGVIFPDMDKRHKTFHDGVIVLDPFPTARFGHPIVVFHINLNSDISYCNYIKGFMADNTTCLQPASRILTSRNANNYRSRIQSSRSLNCVEIIFLPLVHLQSDLPIQENDQLECMPNIEGFHPQCPELRSKKQGNAIPCHPLQTNRDCVFLENSLRNRCSTSQTCDHAVLLSGGWNRQLSDVSSFRNVFNIKQLLITHGFRENNIEIFLANGEINNESYEDVSNATTTTEDYEEATKPNYYSSASKTSMRNHIRTLCDSELCSDSLFIYMNNPTMSDGSSLLWDLYDNGVYEESEMYTPKELMRDISHCTASRVIIMADQSYGAELISAAEARFVSLNNVVIFTSSDEFDYLPNRDRLTNYLLRYQQTDLCLETFKNNFYQYYKSAIYVGSKSDLLNSTLVGGPCFGKEMYLNDPQTEQYRGCHLFSST